MGCSSGKATEVETPQSSKPQPTPAPKETQRETERETQSPPAAESAKIQGLGPLRDAEPVPTITDVKASSSPEILKKEEECGAQCDRAKTDPASVEPNDAVDHRPSSISAPTEVRPEDSDDLKPSMKAKTEPVLFLGGVELNGFKTKQDLQSFDCREEDIAPFTLPVEALIFQPTAETIVTHFKNGDQERKIYCNIKLQDQELERLAALRREAKSAGATFFPFVTAMAGRFVSRARNDPKKALRLMQDTQNWRETYFANGPITESMVSEDFKHGIVYFCGRDFALRPALIIRAKRIPEQWYKERKVDALIRILVFCMEYFLRFMTVPGRVENLNVIVDLKGLGWAQTPLWALKEVYSVMSHHYIGRVYKFYVVNASSTLQAMAGLAKALLTDRQKQKLNVLDDVTKLREDFALCQLEEDLCGKRPIATTFFPFPLVPGPWEARSDADLNCSAVPDAHDALTSFGAMGRIWDPKRSHEENTRLEYDLKAVDIFKRSNLPLPADLHWTWESMDRVPSNGREARPVSRPATVDPKAEQATSSSEVQKMLSGSAPSEGQTDSNDNKKPWVDMDEADKPRPFDEGPQELPEVDGTEVPKAGFFCCRA